MTFEQMKAFIKANKRQGDVTKAAKACSCHRHRYHTAMTKDDISKLSDNEFIMIKWLVTQIKIRQRKTF